MIRQRACTPPSFLHTRCFSPCCCCRRKHLAVAVPTHLASESSSSPLVLVFGCLQAVVDMDNLEEEAAPAFAGADSVFCCLGTTRSVRAAAGPGERAEGGMLCGKPLGEFEGVRHAVVVLCCLQHVTRSSQVKCCCGCGQHRAGLAGAPLRGHHRRTRWAGAASGSACEGRDALWSHAATCGARVPPLCCA